MRKFVVIVTPALAPQQDVDALEALTYLRLGELFDALAHGAIVARIST